MPRQDRYQSRRDNTSFSSSLLDAICRSIDESNGDNRYEDLIFCRDKTIMRKEKQSSSLLRQGEVNDSVQHACMIEKWTQKKQVSGGGVCEIKAFGMDPMLLNSSSSSSDSSCGGGFSSSESDSFCSAKSRSSTSHCHRPKYIHGGVSTQNEPNHHEISSGFKRTKSKAMKIYSDLKTVKQPISPGSKLASFINSLFTSPKKKKKNPKKSVSEKPTPMCSSASSFTRSCLSTTKTTSSKGNAGTGTKRSVRFCPVNVILDEDSRPCGELKIRHENELQASMRKPVMNKVIEYRIIEENRRVAEAARELLNSYRKQKNEEFDIRNIDDNEDDDAASYASSDLFELDHLSAIGNERYLEELPVYETTHFDTNRAIAEGLIL
ncbi:Detected protein of unknown function [Hibiscus syriacus]|uniref:Protein BIG GRAIN 1-like B n=1 Tax=Hibiscus syriacus TaxID=106335 RepID=A0A6A2XIG4_HIBSY|nr:protein BIG GRAIN 1-like A [Hibiscus syriacus]KAE8675302.1 Detected protein of unknown function [Hibiscus syriacus]